jgi:predicted amidohydrolase YtcJ
MWATIAMMGVLGCGAGDSAAPVDLYVVGRSASFGGPRTVGVGSGTIRLVAPDAPRASGVRVIEGDLVTAGFVDAHGHPAGLGARLARLDLTGAGSYAETLERVRTSSGVGWLVGRGWDQNDWSDAPVGGWPIAADLDTLWPDRPVALSRIDGHALWVNTAALRIAGIDAATEDPAGGRILRDATGAPTGILVDNAETLVPIPEPDPAEQERRLRRALDAIAATGLTGVHDMGVDDATLAIYERLDAAHALGLRIHAYLAPDSKAAARLLRDGPWRGDRLAVVGIKTYADGALGSRGALLREPYADEADTLGLPVSSPEELARLARRCAAAQAGLAIHAIGDLGVSRALDAFEAARMDRPAGGPRMRVEHVQVVHPDDFARFAKLGVVASMQPTHATSDMPWAERRVGPVRIRGAYAWRTLLDHHAALAFGSDFPVEEVAPSAGVWAAVTRTDALGQPPGGWYPEQRLDVFEAIDAFTRGAAYAVGEEATSGSATPGAVADLTVWNVDGDERAPRLTPVATIVGGQVVWTAEGGSP